MGEVCDILNYDARKDLHVIVHRMLRGDASVTWHYTCVIHQVTDKSMSAIEMSVKRDSSISGTWRG